MNKSFAKVALAFFVLSFTLASCGGGFYEGYEKVKNENDLPIWDIKDVKKFTVDIQDIQVKYKLSLSLRYASGVRRSSVNSFTLKLTTTSPDGKKTVKDYVINLKDKEGKFLGDAAGDLIDLMTLVEDNYTFSEKGNYTFEVIHNMPPNTSISGILGAGIRLDKIEQK